MKKSIVVFALVVSIGLISITVAIAQQVCDVCGGKGYIRKLDNRSYKERRLVYVNETCWRCGGTGYAPQSRRSTSPGAHTRRGGCFIATAAYGNSLAKHVTIVAEFRDKYLLRYAAGRKFVHLYYRNGPMCAEYIQERPYIKSAVKAALLPAVAFSYVMVNTTPVQKAMTLLSIGIILSVCLSLLTIVMSRRQ